jgi:ribosomal protein S18 acetylase RimI-like enzyme
MNFICQNPNIKIATLADANDITNLLNIAYRGEASKIGWTTEAHLILGNTRTNVQIVEATITQKDSIFLKYSNENNDLVACVNLQLIANKIYLGMLSVLPNQQANGIGKQMLRAANEYAKYLNCESIFMTVISVRTELIDWYKRHGYIDTLQKKAFVEDDVSGKHTQPLEFIVLEKLFLPQRL